AVRTWNARDPGSGPAPLGCHDLVEDIDQVLEVPLGATASVSVPGAPGSLPPLGLLDHEAIAARLPLRAAGVITPAPVTIEGECRLEHAHNWGSPSGGPCAGHRPGVFAEADLVLQGGEGQGILFVAGDLRLIDGAAYHGL